MSYKIVAMCPAGAVTGGPEAIHQLVDMANRVDSNSAAICYLPNDGSATTPTPYEKYNTPIILREDVANDSIVVIPELWPYMVNDFSNKCALWWLSVDNFVCGDTSVLDKYSYHLTQSAYAYHHVNEVLNKSAMMLTDYINQDMMQKKSIDKVKRIAVNPAKGSDLIEEFCLRNKNLDVFRIQGMSKNQICEELEKSMLFIDFGHHPGKDRMPREAAAMGCVVMARRIGAAQFNDDLPIHEIYKFNKVDEISEIVNKILYNYDFHFAQQAQYQISVSNQETLFQNEVSEFLATI